MKATAIVLFTAALCLAVTEAGKFTTFSSGHRVCGNRRFNPKYSVCCGDEIIDGTYGACCGYRGYDTRYYLCCDWKVERRKWYGACCGRQMYDTRTQSCCNGKLC
ncbi:hypothetical protein LSAT2_027100 [Lamellibrachia satsuma]|nr:hypothetical protein LSAT2_027100 [Lamellibrachia satsuma]